MTDLNIKHSMPVVFRKVMGVIYLICAACWLFAHLDSLKIFDWIFIISFIFSGVFFLTNSLGTGNSFIKIGDGCLTIKWINRIKTFLIQDDIIEKITLTRFKIIIFIKDKKPLNLNLNFLERDQKRDVYEFMISYSKLKNIELEKDF